MITAAVRAAPQRRTGEIQRANFTVLYVYVNNKVYLLLLLLQHIPTCKLRCSHIATTIITSNPDGADSINAAALQMKTTFYLITLTPPALTPPGADP